MILRLRHAVPFLQKLSGWTVCPHTTLPLTRYFARPSSAAAAAAAAGANEPDAVPEGSDATAAAQPADQPAKRPRRSQRGSKARAEPSSEAEPDAAVGPSGAGDSAPLDSSPPKKRASSRRKAAAVTGSETAAEAQSGAESAAPGAEAGPQQAAPAKRTRRKRESQGEEAAAADAGSGVAESTSDKTTSTSSGGGSGVSAGRKKRSAGKKAAEAAKQEVEEEKEARVGIRDLVYEDFLILPRKAEQVLIALGILQPPALSDASLPAAAAGAGAAFGGGTAGSSYAAFGATAGGGGFVGASESGSGGAVRPGQLGNVLELANFLGWRHPKDTVVPLLISQYQGYLGADCDLLFDLFRMDFGPPNLSSENIRSAAVGAALRARSRQGGAAAVSVSARGAPAEVVARGALDLLTEAVGEQAVEAQERHFPGLTESQLHFYLMDLASSVQTGEGRVDDIQYLARRCAALQLSRPVVLQRLHRYTAQGASLEDLATSAGKTVKLTQPMEALIEGLKAGVRLDRNRLLADFRLGSPEDPLYEHLPALEKAVAYEAARAADPGGLNFYSPLRGKLQMKTELREAISSQEKRWEQEQDERDGSTLTTYQLRLLFHLGRLERFRREGRRFGGVGG